MRRRLLLFVVVVIFLGIVLSVSFSTHLTGSGEKVGSVIKVSSEGFVRKTNEVEIVRGGMNGGSGAFSTTPLFGTVTDEAVLNQLQDALNNQYEVKVWYRDYWWTPFSSDSDSRYIVAVEKQKSAPAAAVQQSITIDDPVVTVTNGVITISSKSATKR